MNIFTSAFRKRRFGGWGVHANTEGKISIFGVETSEYQDFLGAPDNEKIKAMRSKRN